ncbi:hypothetical protein D5S18_17565 [Nocardia panacis]|uniref:Delta-aminolevulinic acid dehydratase n=1 Tax=Nocardia panacis TaxID=2340916 RepID=A0A3A4KJS9_9NOCA|nr:hypothetical protein [Nocardia panacis]RJO75172.1 hypothetical protein D5S18_17565 [Nocardia panacis]
MNSTPTTVTAPVRPRQEVTGINPVRARARVRALHHRELLTAANLIVPILVQPDARPREEYSYLPTAVPISQLGRYVSGLREHGIRACKVFVFCESKAPDAADALRPDNLMVAAIQTIRAATGDMVISTEVCGCAWTDSGECVITDARGRTDVKATYLLMGQMAVLHAEAGADIIGPAAMLDGSVQVIRHALHEHGHPDVGVTPSVIFDSGLFAAYKTAMRTDPGRGNRRGFQIDAEHQRQALTQAQRWMSEGADGLLIQPAMMTVDVLTRLRMDTDTPLTAFSVSQEQQMHTAVDNPVVLEYARMLCRAGADFVMTYDGPRIARALAEGL